MGESPVTGVCDARFAAVRQAFSQNFVERGELGAGVCVILDGRVVVDLVGGWTDQARTQRWRPDTLVDIYSAGKPVLATVALRLVDEGRMDLEDTISSVWPAFGAHGKGEATLRQALSHRAGVPAIREPLTNDSLWDWEGMATALAATEPWWEPGTRHAYHVNTYGHLIGEVIRRVGGAGYGDLLQTLAASLEADLWCGLPATLHSRCAEIVFVGAAATGTVDVTGLSGDALMTTLGYFNPVGYSSMGVVNSAAWRGAEIPSTNSHGTAGGLARFYAGLFKPGRILSAELLAEATSAQSEGYCPFLEEETTFGLGFKPTTPRRPFGPNPGSFGHFGTGGAVGFADPDAAIAFGYVMNHVIPRWQSSRNRALIDALYGSM